MSTATFSGTDLSKLRQNSERSSLNVFTVAKKSPITARNGLSVNPEYALDTSPKPDILLVPSGIGTRTEVATIVGSDSGAL